MDHATTTTKCPDCPRLLPLDEFVLWGAHTEFKTIVCPGCGSTVTFATSADGSVDTSHAPLGRGVHGTTREGRQLETLLSRPRLEQRE